MSIFERLVGLETEYAIRFQPSSHSEADSATDLGATQIATKRSRASEAEESRRFNRFAFYQALTVTLGRALPVLPAKHFKEGVFTATGGAVWFEAERPAAGGGLIEGSTPECRGPRQVLAYQRAQDRLLGQAARDVSLPGSYRLLKNDRDAFDNVYGAQENYDVMIGTRWERWIWRSGLVLMFPLILFTWLCLLVMIVGLLVYLAVAGIFYGLARLVVKRPQQLAYVLFGQDLVDGRETGSPTPAWLESLLLLGMRLFTAPLAVGLLCLTHWAAFRSTRRKLTPFLVTRSLFAGAGMVQEDSFCLSDKGTAINSVVGFGGFVGERPIYTMGHFFKAMCVEICFSPRDYFELFHRRQRLQIGLGDSNMSEVAEFLRVGTTLLVLDAIEAGYITSQPVPCQAIKSMHGVAKDPSLTARFRCTDGRDWSALEVQRWYYEACLRFVEDQAPADVPDEAVEVLARWQDVLDLLDEYAETGQRPRELVGVLDWATKLFLLEETSSNALSVRKKIDLRYHELSDEGYFAILAASGIAQKLLDEEEINRAMRLPPPESPATVRGHYIREFSGAGEKLAVNWKLIRVSHGDDKTVRLIRYRDRRRRTTAPPPASDHLMT